MIYILIALLILIPATGLLWTAGKGCLPWFHPAREARPGQTRVACVGDSITYGHGIRGWFRNSYPAVLGRLLGPGYCVNNYGYSGRTAGKTGDYPYTQERLYRKSLAFQPDIVILMLGTNDSKPTNWRGREAFREDLREIIRAYRQLSSSPTVFLMLPPPAWPLDGKPVQYDIRADVIADEIRPAVRAIADEEGLPLIDLYEVFANKAQMFPDGVHPNAEGAKLIAETVYHAMQQTRRDKP